MRILTLSNFYPPVSYGGYDLRCGETMVELVKRGHAVQVLTCRIGSHPVTTLLDGVMAHRVLHLEADPRLFHTAIRFFFKRKGYERQNRLAVQRVVNNFAPDVIFIWGMWNVPWCVPHQAELSCPGQVVYHISDYWLALPSAYEQYWQKKSGRWFTVPFKKWLGQIALSQLAREHRFQLRLEHPTCVSYAVRNKLIEAGVPIQHGEVLHSGIDIKQFAYIHRPRTDKVIRLVYAGRLTHDKGVHTALRAMGQLIQQRQNDITLDIIGDGENDYKTTLKAIIKQEGIEGKVRFLGKRSKPEMPAMFTNYDVLVFPSEWDEPFSGVVMEAMAAGLVVIGTTVGGTAEVLVDNETGLVFPVGDSKALANSICRLIDEPLLRERLAHDGRRTILKRFTLQQMVDRFETYLQGIVDSVAP